MERYKKLFFCFIVVLLISATFSVLSTTVLAADDIDSATVDVSVNSVTQISVTPTTLGWTLNPGSAGSATSLGVKNTGSQNVKDIYAYTNTLDVETSRPYGTGDPSKYAASGVIVFHNSSDANFYFAGRLEWNWTSDVSGKDLSNISATSRVAWGFYKNTSNDYFWALGNGTDGFCNNTGAVFAIESDPDTGVTSTRSPSLDDTHYDGGDAIWGYFSVNRTGSLYQSCVAALYNCTKIYIYKYDKRTGTGTNFATCSNSTYIQRANLVPGDIHTLTLNVYTPSGIPAGSLAQSQFTVYAYTA